MAIEYGRNAIITWMATDKLDTEDILTSRIYHASRCLACCLRVCSSASLSFHSISSSETWVVLGLPTIGDVISESSADPISFGLWYLVHQLYLAIASAPSSKNRSGGVNDVRMHLSFLAQPCVSNDQRNAIYVSANTLRRNRRRRS
ncbi:MAG: hypothetical protein MZU97_26430 [Bacillus subtilis]|nr:hypothetical protein [Bacillus subtilis]